MAGVNSELAFNYVSTGALSGRLFGQVGYRVFIATGHTDDFKRTNVLRVQFGNAGTKRKRLDEWSAKKRMSESRE